MTASWEFEAIGTHWRLDVAGDATQVDGSPLMTLQRAVAERIEAFDKTYSRFRDDSLVTQMSRDAGTYELPPDADELLKVYSGMYDISDGLVTPLIGQVLSDAGYDAHYKLQPGELARPPAWNDAMEYVPGTNAVPPKLHIKHPVLLDFGAAGKGYLVDLVCDVLEAGGVNSYCVDAGGDMRHHDASGGTLRVGLEHPADPSAVIGVADVSNFALCGSAGNRRAWQGLHHIMNPHSLQPVQDIVAVWTMAPTALIADAVATGLFFVEAAKLKAVYDFEYVVVHSDYSYERSPGFKGEMLGV